MSMASFLKRVGISTACLITISLAATPLAFATSVTNEYAIPTSGSEPWGITPGSDGNLWFAEDTGNQIGKITPSGTITEYPITTSGSGVTDITAGSDGNMWFTEESTNKIGKITPGGVVTEYTIPVSPSDPFELTPGPDGNIWFTANAYQNAANAAIGKITPSGTITLYPTTTPNSGPSAITTGSDGNLWFTESTANKIGKITPSGTITEYAAPAGITSPSSIAEGSNGEIWFGGNVAEIGETTTSGSMTTFPIASGRAPTLMTPGSDGAVWFTEAAGYIATISTAGTVTEYHIPTASSQPVGITLGPDGNMWFAEQFGNKIGYVSGLTAVPVTQTITNAVNGAAVQVATPGATRQTCANSAASASLPKTDSGYTYPLGLVNVCFTSLLMNNQVTLTFITNLSPSQVVARDYNTKTNSYATIPGAVITSTTYNGQNALQLTYTLTDNGPFDSNSSFGFLADPVGLAEAVEPMTPNTGYGSPSVTNQLPYTIIATVSVLSLSLGLVLLNRCLQSRTD